MNVRKNAYELKPGDVFRLPDGEVLRQQYSDHELDNKSYPPEEFALVVGGDLALVMDRDDGYDPDWWSNGCDFAALTICAIEPETEIIMETRLELREARGTKVPRADANDVTLFLRGNARKLTKGHGVAVVNSGDPKFFVEVEVVGNMQCAWRWIGPRP